MLDWSESTRAQRAAEVLSYALELAHRWVPTATQLMIETLPQWLSDHVDVNEIGEHPHDGDHEIYLWVFWDDGVTPELDKAFRDSALEGLSRWVGLPVSPNVEPDRWLVAWQELTSPSLAYDVITELDELGTWPAAGLG